MWTTSQRNFPWETSTNWHLKPTTTNYIWSCLSEMLYGGSSFEE
jgi:hypothetical protein